MGCLPSSSSASLLHVNDSWWWGGWELSANPEVTITPNVSRRWTTTVLVPIFLQDLERRATDGRKTGLWMTDNKKKAVIRNKFMRTLCLSRWILIFHITGSGFSFYFNFYLHTSVSLCECLCMHAWCPPKPEESISFPGTGFQGPSCRCWSSNTGLLEEQPVLLTGKLSL